MHRIGDVAKECRALTPPDKSSSWNGSCIFTIIPIVLKCSAQMLVQSSSRDTGWVSDMGSMVGSKQRHWLTFHDESV